MSGTDQYTDNTSDVVIDLSDVISKVGRNISVVCENRKFFSKDRKIFHLALEWGLLLQYDQNIVSHRLEIKVNGSLNTHFHRDTF